MATSMSFDEALDGLILHFAVGVNNACGHVRVLSVSVDVKAEILSLDGGFGSRGIGKVQAFEFVWTLPYFLCKGSEDGFGDFGGHDSVRECRRSVVGINFR